MHRQMWTAFGIMLGTVMSLAFFNVRDTRHITGLNWRLMLASVRTASSAAHSATDEMHRLESLRW